MNLNCPNCKHQLSRIQLELVEVDHCNNCGATLFDYNEINRISVSDAEKLSLMKETNDISGDEKFSPRDGSPLKRVPDESVPQHVTLLRSDTTQEVFAFADDLINFKKAQEAKLTFFKAWHIPLPALSSVLVFGFVVAVSVSTVLLSSRLTQPHSQIIRASELCQNGIQVFSSDDPSSQAYAVTCETTSLLACKAEVTCNGSIDEFVFTNTPSRIHSGFIPSSCTTIRMVCNDNNLTLQTDVQSLK